MKVRLERLNDAVHFKATNATGNTLEVDGAESIGGEGKGMRPMEVLLSALASCGAFDVVSILKKKKQVIDKMYIDVEGERDTSKKAPTPFVAANIHFTFEGGELEDKAVARSIELGVEKYCSVAESLDPNMKITHSYEIK